MKAERETRKIYGDFTAFCVLLNALLPSFHGATFMYEDEENQMEISPFSRQCCDKCLRSNVERKF